MRYGSSQRIEAPEDIVGNFCMPVAGKYRDCPEQAKNSDDGERKSIERDPPFSRGAQSKTKLLGAGLYAFHAAHAFCMTHGAIL
jgi:hypothetical protein